MATSTANPIDFVQGKMKELEEKFNVFKKKQPPAVSILIDGLQGSTQGVLVGVVSFWFNKNLTSMNAPNPNMTPEMKAQMEKMAAMQPKTVLGSVKNFVVLFGVQAALSAALKHYRKDKDDVWNAVYPAIGAGAAFALASGVPDQAISMAVGFGAFSGLFHKIGEWTGNTPGEKGAARDSKYLRSFEMLTYLKLEKFHRNLKNGQLTDDTIMLWNDAALQECRIPPGPRLLILHHLSQVRDRAVKPGSAKAGDSAGAGDVKRALSPAMQVAVPASYRVGLQ